MVRRAACEDRWSLPLVELAAHAEGVCPVCKGAPKTVCAACGKLGDSPPEPEKKPRRRRKPAGPAESRP
jgi:hypothetical protein